MRTLRQVFYVLAFMGAAASWASAAELKSMVDLREDYERAPMPPGFQVVATEIEGPVFADATGKTLYRWPLKGLRNGDAGEQKGKPSCDDTRYTVTSGLMSPYPPGLELPDLDTRPTCAQAWPPVLAAADAKGVGKWSIVTRNDGAKQWAYDGYALYTSVLDHETGDVNGGTRRRTRGDAPAYREPVSPPPNLPPQFQVAQTALGRLLIAGSGFSVYASDKDGPNKSNCTGGCTKEWAPVLAPAYAKAQGDLTIFERAPGINQWAFRNMPLYTHVVEEDFRSLEGSDVPGWHNVYTQKAPPPPNDFTVQDTRSGQVLADSRSMTVYIYNCGDDAVDQLACDHPDTPQVYRFAMCGGGDPERCLTTFPYVIASKDAKSTSRVWSIMEIDTKSGHRAKPGQTDALRVWAFRDRPVFTFARDRHPGDISADGWGEFNGWRNGFKAYWLRDAFRNNDG